MTINTAMLVGLGFLVAALFAVLIAPAYRRRTVRLTTAALKRSLPLTEAEMRADKDRLRADHAIRIHNLEAKLESVTLSSARQKIEVNRRDARISELEGLTNQQKNQIEELENARRVLEQTVTDRLPKIENRLGEAKKLLAQRDTEVSSLAQTAQKQARALGEATQINIQQSGEIERLTTAITTRAARNQETLGDARFDGELALRSEIDALRSKTRDQAALITQLQDIMAQQASGAAGETIAAAAAAAISNENAAGAQISRLQSELGEVHGALLSARTAAEVKMAGAGATDAELAQLRTANQDLTAETARLKAALAAFEQPDLDRKVKDSPIAMKAKVSSLEALSREQATTIASLRAEAAAVNERLARQSAHYMEEMKRLGAGTLPASGEARRAATEQAKRPLADRIQDRRVVRLTPVADTKQPEFAAVEIPRVDSSALFSLNDPASIRTEQSVSVAPANDKTAPPAPAVAATAAPAQPRRPRLLERITSIDKPGSN
ncbi:MAG: hypothetical protein ABL901_12350 [Hyphomicrobiaceae bacterium]